VNDRASDEFEDQPPPAEAPPAADDREQQPSPAPPGSPAPPPPPWWPANSPQLPEREQRPADAPFPGPSGNPGPPVHTPAFDHRQEPSVTRRIALSEHQRRRSQLVGERGAPPPQNAGNYRWSDEPAPRSGPSPGVRDTAAWPSSEAEVHQGRERPGRDPDNTTMAPVPAAAPGNWNYVEGLRSSELVPTRKVPPGRGWRRALFSSTFGLINLGLSPDERRQVELETKIRSLLRGHYKIGVLGKGGTGKTTIAASVGSLIAELRQDDRVVAIDADTAFGKLGSRVDPRASGSYWELAADQHLYSFADVRSRVGNNDSGLFVLAGEATTARRRVLDPGIYREATKRLDNHFTISIIDCGSTMDSPVTQEVLRDLDALIVVSSPWVDGASAAGQTMEWLANNGYTGLLHRTVVVLNDSDGHADKRTRSVLVEQFSSRGQLVVEVPYDGHLRPGGVIDVDNELRRLTRRRLTEIAAAIAEHFVTTTDGPRERR
jgi:MinD-like ATPase involved in chromosome partitioning or flagellar assembly